MKYQSMAFLSLSILLLIVSTGYSGGTQQFDAKGYNIQAFFDEGPGKIEVHGQISGGKRCKNLKIEFFLVSDKGRRGHVITVADDVGGAGSRLFRGMDDVYGVNNEWKFTSVYVECVSGENIEKVDRSDPRKSARSSGDDVEPETSTSIRRPSKYPRKSKIEPTSSEKPLRIYEDDKGVLHIEQ